MSIMKNFHVYISPTIYYEVWVHSYKNAHILNYEIALS